MTTPPNKIRFSRLGLVLAAACWIGAPFAAWAQAPTVVLSGLSGQRALLVIDGGVPRFVGVGEARNGVRVLSIAGDTVTVERDGVRQSLRMGQDPLSLAPVERRDAQRIVMQANGGGHFVGMGQINGKPVQFIVDTGATLVILSQADADRIGLAYKQGRAVQVNTANGAVQGFQMRLNSLRLGGVEVFDVDSVVLPQAMPYVLLGNSFLSRFQMQRNNDQMVLERRF